MSLLVLFSQNLSGTSYSDTMSGGVSCMGIASVGEQLTPANSLGGVSSSGVASIQETYRPVASGSLLANGSGSVGTFLAGVPSDGVIGGGSTHSVATEYGEGGGLISGNSLVTQKRYKPPFVAYTDRRGGFSCQINDLRLKTYWRRIRGAYLPVITVCDIESRRG
jgi:hypothetical protein